LGIPHNNTKSVLSLLLWEVSRIVVIAEKPFVARDIAQALCGPTFREGRDRHEGQVGHDLLHFSWANGHIAELADPEIYNPNWKVWSVATLPIVPTDLNFLLEVTQPTRLRAIESAITGADEVVNACDAGREGELIFDEIARILEFGRWPEVKQTRMWISDTTPGGLRRAYEDRIPSETKRIRLLREAARVRSEADWLWGINLTRYATLGLGGVASGADRQTVHIGRVQTALLKAVTDRTRTVRNHTPEPFYQVDLTCEGSGGKWQAKLISHPDEQFGHRDIDFRNEDHVREMVRHLEATTPQKWQVHDAPYEEALEYAPPPFRLVDLQRSAFRIHRWTAQYTLRVAQELYLRHKAISYPRTDCVYLPEEMQTEVLERRRRLWNDWGQRRFPALQSLPFDEQAEFWFNTRKVKDHYGIIPTGPIPPVMDSPGKISDAYRLWELIATRFLHAWIAPARTHVASRILIREYKGGQQLRGILKTNPVVAPGWLLYEEATLDTRRTSPPLRKRLEEKIMPPCGPIGRVTRADVRLCSTFPPDYFDYDSILHFMVKHGLGTSATRADVIEKLLDRHYLVQSTAGTLFSSDEGSRLVDLLEMQGGGELMDVQITAFWEQRLEQMERSTPDRLPREVFLRNLVEQITGLGIRLVAEIDQESVVFCPKKNTRVVLVHGRYQFDGYPDAPTIEVFYGRRMKASEYRDILMNEKKGGGPYQGFISTRSGTSKVFSACVLYNSRTKKFVLSFKRHR